MKTIVRKRSASKATTLHKQLVEIKATEIMADLKNTIKGLTSLGKQQVLDYLLLAIQQETPTTDKQRKLAMWQDSLNNELGNMLGQHQRMFPQSMSAAAKKILVDVDEFMATNDLLDLTTGETKVMYNLLAKILVNQAVIVSARIRIPLSMKLVLQTTIPVVSLFDSFFPGYIKAKLVKQILLVGIGGVQHDDDED